MKKSIYSIILYLIIFIYKSKQEEKHIIYALFGDTFKSDLIYYGFIDLDKSEYNIISTLNIDDIGNPRNRKYEILPLTYDPSNDIIFISAINNLNKTILSVINATTGSLLYTFNKIPYEIISLQYDIFNKKLFAHTETNNEYLTQIVEIDTNNGNLKQIFGQIYGVEPTDISTYCPICRKYFLIMFENDHYIYVEVNTSDDGGISSNVSLNFSPFNIIFNYKTFTIYSTYINQTDRNILQIGILNRTSGCISQVIETISNPTHFVLTKFSTFDIENNLYYISNIVTQPFSREIIYINVNTSQTMRISLPNTDYNFYAWFIKQFVQ
ncbi:unnamed protein product [Rotaria sordida]|uniref:Uncharacterized protein n=1 Tax=Rotaria sordida TaxID=392033 RepID=A0A814GGS1_9BILA|nr:unnamed protein product [Rotaria sordida]CAF1096649.1 unnamed protein product [Rotaria sordida]